LFHYAFTAESDGERTLKIGQHLAKLWTRVGCPGFFDLWGILATINEISVVRDHCIYRNSRIFPIVGYGQLY